MLTTNHPARAGDPLPGAAPRETPGLSLLVCTLGRGEQIARLFDSLAAQSRADFEVVLVDQNAPGFLDPVIARYRDRLTIVHVRSPPGLSRARNAGLPLCSAPLVGFPDDDCWYPVPLVAEIVAAFAARPDLSVLTGRTIDRDGRPSLGIFHDADTVIRKGNVWFAGNSNSLFVRREAAWAVAGFDETLGVGAPTSFKSGEETDFILRILARGGRAEYRRDVMVHHDQVLAAGAAAGARRATAYSRGFGRVLRLHRYGGGYLGFRLARSVAGGAIALARGDVDGARYKALWAWGTLCGYVDRSPVMPRGAGDPGAFSHGTLPPSALARGAATVRQDHGPESIRRRWREGIMAALTVKPPSSAVGRRDGFSALRRRDLEGDGGRR